MFSSNQGHSSSFARSSPTTPPSASAALDGLSQTSSPPWTPAGLARTSSASSASDTSSSIGPSIPSTPQIRSVPLPSEPSSPTPQRSSPPQTLGLASPPITPVAIRRSSISTVSTTRTVTPRPIAIASHVSTPLIRPSSTRTLDSPYLTSSAPPVNSLVFATQIRRLNPILEPPAILHPLCLSITLDLSKSFSPSLIIVNRASQHLPPTRACKPSMLTEPAIYPAVSSLTVHLAGLPDWSFTVTATRAIYSSVPPQITASDVLYALAAQMHIPVSQEDWTRSGPLRSGSGRAFHRRAASDPGALAIGLKRVDFLCGKTLFAGLREKRSLVGEYEALFIEPSTP